MPVQDFDPKSDGYGGKYIRGADFEDGPEYLTITDVNLVAFADETRKLALTFNDGREATVNKRNYTRLVDKWGGDPNAWIGKTVLCLAGDKFNGNTSLVMHPQPTQKTPKPAPKPVAAATEEDAEDVVFA